MARPTAIVIIPARYASARFPGKPLVPIAGKPLIRHVYERSKGARLADRVIVATDNLEIFNAVESFGGEAVMTSPSHASGTDRIAEAASKTDYDIIVNVQGDEPLMRPEMIDAVIGLLDDERASMSTLARKTSDPSEVFNPNVVKAVTDAEGFALYFSRSPIPFHRDLWKGPAENRPGGEVLKHIGIYAYRKDALLRLSGLPQGRLEKIELLEQLRALENGLRIKIALTEYDTVGVDAPDDIGKVEKWLSTSL